MTTPQAASRLTRWGFSAHGLETWTSTVLEKGPESLRVTSLPAVHARGLMGQLLPPVMGTLLEQMPHADLSGFRLYVMGDTLAGDHLDEIATRYPDIDAVVVHLGGTRVCCCTPSRWTPVKASI